MSRIHGYIQYAPCEEQVPRMIVKGIRYMSDLRSDHAKLEARIAALEAEVAALKARLDASEGDGR